jgi:CRISPR-associated endonuclease/helicase Cas3
MLSETDVARLTALVFLHDIGKLHPGFQAKADRNGRPWPGPPVRHSQAGGGFLELAACETDHPFHATVARIIGWGPAVSVLLPAVLAHHGRPVGASHTLPKHWPAVGDYNWRANACYMAQFLDTALPAALLPGPDLPEHHGFVHLVAGLTALADWIGSNRDHFDFVAEPDDTYPAKARSAAQDALVAIGLDVRTRAAPHTDFQKISGFSVPNPAQAAIARLSTKDRLVILEAETGSGKTEAALLRFAHLFKAGAVSGMYFAVPTRAAARQLHGRVNSALARMFRGTAPDAVLAIPGMRVAGTATGQMLSDFNVRWDDTTGPVPARWAAEHATRFLAATVAVGTVDQALLAALQVKHAHMRGSALSRSLLVIDEVHASDAYMTEITKALLDAHLATGGHALLMSATLGSQARCRYLGQPQPDFTTAAAVAYPAVWTNARSDPVGTEVSGHSKTVQIETRDTMDSEPLATEVIAAATAGARVLVIRNTVGAAVQAFRAVLDAGGSAHLMQVAGGPAMHHSRFAAEDRALLDAAAEAALSPKRPAGAGGVIVIGSQTLEQSLDIDADILFTDLCPMDVLLQRIGRLHRHSLSRPHGFHQPCAVVLLPDGGLDRLAAPAFENGLGGWKSLGGTFHGVYTDLAGLELTRRLMIAQPHWQIPAMNRALVEGATHPDKRDALIQGKGAVWEAYEIGFLGKQAIARTMGQHGVLRRDRPFPLQFKSDDEKIMTRLGEEGPILTLQPGTVGAFGHPVTRLALPARWAHGFIPDVPVEVVPVEGGFTFVLGDSSFGYSRVGLDRL